MDRTQGFYDSVLETKGYGLFATPAEFKAKDFVAQELFYVLIIIIIINFP